MLHIRVPKTFGYSFSVKHFSSLEDTLVVNLRGFWHIRVDGPGIPSHAAVKLETEIAQSRCGRSGDALMYLDDMAYIAGDVSSSVQQPSTPS